MIPIKLTIEGLYSYRERQTIDFTNLTQAGLFGIFGATGSGKSSLTDAMSLAIYGEVDRMNMHDKRNYNLMNLKSNQLYIEFEFSAGKGNKHFKASYLLKRNSKKFENVSSPERSAQKLLNGTWVPCDISDLKDAIGMEHENFKRTIIIPQGKFRDFLDLTATERTRMLRDLFDLNRYDLAPIAKEKYSKTNLEVQRITGELSGIEHVTKEAIEEREKKAIEINKERTELEKNVKSTETSFNLLENIRSIANEYQLVNNDLLALKKLEIGMQENQVRVDLFRKVQSELVKPITEIDNLNAQINTNTNQTLKQTELTTQFEAELKNVIANLALLEAEVKKIPEWQKQSDDVIKAAKLEGLKKEINELVQKLENAKKFFPKKEEEKSLLLDRLKQLEANREQLQHKRTDQTLLDISSEFFMKNESIENELKQLNFNSQKAQKAKNQLSEQKSELTIEFADFNIKNPTSEVITALLSELKTNSVKLSEERDELLGRKVLDNLSDTLTDGQPCPLCGSLNHPHKHTPSETKSQILAIDAQLAQISNQVSALQVLHTQWVGLIAQIDKSEVELAEANQALSLLNEKKNAFLNDHRFANRIENHENLVELKKANIAIDQQKAEMEREEKILRTKLEELEKTIKEQTEKKNQAENELATKQSEYNTLKGNINPTAIELLTNSGKTAKQLADELLAKINRVNTTYKQSIEASSTLEANLRNARDRIETLSADKVKLESDLANVMLLANQSASKLGLNSLDECKEILSKKSEFEKMEAQVKQYFEQLKALEVKATTLEKQLEGKKFDQTEYDQLKNALSTLKGKLAELMAEIGALTHELELFKANLKRKLVLEEKLKVLNQRLFDLNKLTSLFKGEAFINFISRFYLQNLITEANKRFRVLSRNSLELTLGDSNEFLIIDHLNSGRQRAIKTLSGGQAFQAALSLALSLTDSLRAQMPDNANFFFLDEGFGVLDTESLRVALETLRNLKNENRIVGIISHVEELQQEIPVYLQVTNTEANGSVVSRGF